MILLIDEKSKDAVITASDTNSNYPINNVIDSRLSRVYRSSTTSINIVFDMTSAVNVTTIAIANHNLSSGATITLEANATNAWTSPSVSKSITYDSGIITLVFDSETYRYWRLVISDSGNADGYIQIGRIWLGEYYSVKIGKTIGHTRKSESIKSISVSGQSYQDVRYKASLISVKIPKLTHQQKADLITEFDRIDIGEPFFVDFDESCSDLGTLYVTLDADQISFNLLSNVNYYESSLNFREEV